MENEKVLRIQAFADATGYAPSTIRKKIFRKEISYFKVGRNIVIPQSEIVRLLGELRPRVED